jgi:hypothetical protein
MIRVYLRVLGLILAVVALHEAFFAMIFRLESSFELRQMELHDLDIGGVFALAFVLLFGPGRWKAPRAWLLTALCALLVWGLASGALIWSQRVQYHFHSTRSVSPRE